MRGCEGFGSIFSIGISRTAVGVRAESRLMMPACVSDSCWKIRLPASRKDFVRRSRVLSMGHLFRELEEALRGLRAGVVCGDRHARAGRLADLHRLADHGAEDRMVAGLLQRVEHDASQDRPAVVESP